ncbi:hypothetical protein [Salinibaculum rarum]|uniref:DNA replication complex subunit Gins51 n=1 Tax=Salinibaculum rarum TaxID=3058903 RepID=UPI0026600130|nr:hypothetical protein [Salinibaculum sp. KK48]
MNLDDLHHYRKQARDSDSLQDLPNDFYEEAATYIADLKAERDEIAAESDDPFSDQEVRLLSDEVDTAQSLLEAIYERRVGKLVKASSFSAAGLNNGVDESTLANREQSLFDDLTSRLVEDREAVDPLFTGTPEPSETDLELTDTSEADTDPETPADTENSVDENVPESELTQSKDESGVTNPNPESADENTSSDDGVARTSVRVTVDVGEVFGVDEREYDLKKGDVVTLPTANAEPLIEKNAAERLEDTSPDDTRSAEAAEIPA